MPDYEIPAVELLTDEQTSQERRIVLRLLEPDRIFGPLAPASLWRLSGEMESLLELHRLIEARGDTCVFATSDRRPLRIAQGWRIGLGQWWTPYELELVADTTLEWRKAPFDDENMVDYCPLCYRGLEEPEPVWLAAARPICSDCHAKFIVTDYLGVRTSSR